MLLFERLGKAGYSACHVFLETSPLPSSKNPPPLHNQCSDYVGFVPLTISSPFRHHVLVVLVVIVEWTSSASLHPHDPYSYHTNSEFLQPHDPYPYHTSITQTVHPYTLMALIPITGVVYLGLNTFRDAKRGDMREGSMNNGNTVNAWYNSRWRWCKDETLHFSVWLYVLFASSIPRRAKRWETPQPWNEEYRKWTGEGNALKLVDRSLVHDGVERK